MGFNVLELLTSDYAMTEQHASQFFSAVAKNLSKLYKQMCGKISNESGKCFPPDSSKEHQLFKQIFTLLVIERFGIDFPYFNKNTSLQNVVSIDIQFDSPVYVELREVLYMLLSDNALNQLQERFIRMFFERKQLIKQIVMMKYPKISNAMMPLYATLQACNNVRQTDVIASEVAPPTPPASPRTPPTSPRTAPASPSTPHASPCPSTPPCTSSNLAPALANQILVEKDLDVARQSRLPSADDSVTSLSPVPSINDDTTKFPCITKPTSEVGSTVSNATVDQPSMPQVVTVTEPPYMPPVATVTEPSAMPPVVTVTEQSSMPPVVTVTEPFSMGGSSACQAVQTASEVPTNDTMSRNISTASASAQDQSDGTHSAYGNVGNVHPWYSQTQESHPTSNILGDLLQPTYAHPIYQNPAQHVSSGNERRGNFSTGNPSQQVTQESRKRRNPEHLYSNAPQCKRSAVWHGNNNLQPQQTQPHRNVQYEHLPVSTHTVPATTNTPFHLQELQTIIRMGIKPNQLEIREYTNAEQWRACYTCHVFLGRGDLHDYPNHDVKIFHFRRDHYTCHTCNQKFHVTEQFIHHMRNGHPTLEQPTNLTGLQEQRNLPKHNNLQYSTQGRPGHFYPNQPPPYEAVVLGNPIQSSSFRNAHGARNQNPVYPMFNQQYPNPKFTNQIPKSTLHYPPRMMQTTSHHPAMNVQNNLLPQNIATSSAMASHTNHQHPSMAARLPQYLSNATANNTNQQNHSMNTITTQDNPFINSLHTNSMYTNQSLNNRPVQRKQSGQKTKKKNKKKKITSTITSESNYSTALQDHDQETRATPIIQTEDHSDATNTAPSDTQQECNGNSSPSGSDIVDFTRVLNIEPLVESEVTPIADDAHSLTSPGYDENCLSDQTAMAIKTEDNPRRNRFELHIDLRDDIEESMTTTDADLPADIPPVSSPTQLEPCSADAATPAPVENNSPTRTEDTVKEESNTTSSTHLIPLMVDLTDFQSPNYSGDRLENLSAETVVLTSTDGSSCDAADEVPLDLRTSSPPSEPLDLSASSDISPSTCLPPVMSEHQNVEAAATSLGSKSNNDKFESLWMKLGNQVEEQHRTPSPMLSPATVPDENRLPPRRLSFTPPLMDQTNLPDGHTNQTTSITMPTHDEDDILSIFIANDSNNNIRQDVDHTRSDSQESCSLPKMLETSSIVGDEYSSGPSPSSTIPYSMESCQSTPVVEHDNITFPGPLHTGASHDPVDCEADQDAIYIDDSDSEENTDCNRAPDSEQFTRNSVPMSSSVQQSKTCTSQNVNQTSSTGAAICCCPKPINISSNECIVLSDDEEDDPLEQGSPELDIVNDFSMSPDVIPWD